MSEKKIHISALPEFDMASHLNNEEEIAAYLTMVIEEGDASELARPRFETINRVCAALGVRLVAKPMHDHDGDLMHNA